MDHLSILESQSIFIFRETFNKFDRLAMFWSIGKDSNVMLWFARKVFLGHVSFPAIHVDTTYKIPEMIKFRERVAMEWGLDLIVHSNGRALSEGMNHTFGKVNCCTALKTEPLKDVVRKHGFAGIVAGRGGDPRKGACIQPARDKC